MSAPNGATHALEDLIWRKPLPKIEDGKFYDVRLYDSVTGRCCGKLYRRSAGETRDAIAQYKDVRVFIYPTK